MVIVFFVSAVVVNFIVWFSAIIPRCQWLRIFVQYSARVARVEFAHTTRLLCLPAAYRRLGNQTISQV